MQQQEIHEFLMRYFQANGCDDIENGKGFMTVQLTEQIDKELMNRPFYWHYLEKTGGIANPAKLTLITDKRISPANLNGEQVHFGSPRLHQIFQSTKKLAGYIRLYEKHPSSNNGSVPLHPWLGLNVRISYQCDRKRDVLRSIGLQLINGKMIGDFHNILLNLELTPKIPDYSFTLSPLIMAKSGILRIEKFLRKEIEGEDHQWATDARERWQKDLELLEHFYEDSEEKGESYQIEKLALQEQYEPQITISIINGGLFYLTETAI